MATVRRVKQLKQKTKYWGIYSKGKRIRAGFRTKERAATVKK